MEKKKQVKCPKCGAVLSVPNPNDLEYRTISCPNCKTRLKVHFRPVDNSQPLDAHTYLAPQGSAGSTGGYDGETQLGQQSAYRDGETQLGGSSYDSGETQLSLSTASARAACLVSGGREYTLQRGQNIIGRMASTSTASLQIETPDRYMSRQHARIVVTSMAGGRLKAVISNYHNKNITSVGGMLLGQDDAVVLSSGDVIVMGKTTLTYKEK